MESEIRRPIAKGARRCAFTGYRPMKMPFGYDEECPLTLDFKHRLHDTIEMLILQGYKHMISGGAQGMDIMAAEAVLELQKEYPDVTLEIAVPFEAQAAKWAADYRARWQECIDRADVVTVLSHEYTKKCLFARNRYLVTQADILLACFDGKVRYRADRAGDRFECEYSAGQADRDEQAGLSAERPLHTESSLSR